MKTPSAWNSLLFAKMSQIIPHSVQILVNFENWGSVYPAKPPENNLVNFA